MKKSRKIILFITIFIIMIHTVSIADVGSFDRYDSGSSSSSWDSSSSSSSRDYSSSSSSRDYSSSSKYSGGGLSKEELIIFLIIYVGVPIIIVLMSRKAMERSFEKSVFEYRIGVDRSKSKKYVKQIKNIDPNFSEEKMLEWTKNLFVKLQNAWTARDWEPMRIYETQSLFEQHNKQVQGYIDTNRINVMEEIRIINIAIYKFSQEGDRDILDIALESRMKDYIIDATTKKVLEGNKKQDRGNIYRLTFERKTGIKTVDENEKIVNCPNCGAQTKITAAGKCEYCGSIVTTGENNWVLANLEPFRKK